MHEDTTTASTFSASSPQIGCSTVMFAGDLAEKLAAMRAAGFVHTELTASDLFGSLRGVEYTLDLVTRSGLQVSAYSLIRDYEGCVEGEIATRTKIAEQLMDQANMVGTDLLIICSNTSDDCSTDKRRMRDDLRRLGDLAARRNVRLVYEALCWGTRISDYREAWDLVDSVDHPHVGLLLDSSHIGALSLPLAGIRQIDPRKIFHVQVADLPKANLPVADLSRYYRMLPNEGVLPLNEFVGALQEIGYAGIYSLEVLSDRYRALPPALAAQQAMLSMTQLMTDALR